LKTGPATGQKAKLNPTLRGPDSDFVFTSLAVCRNPYYNGTLYALPYVGNSQLYFYRKDLFEKHHLKAPATWEDVLIAARTIQEQETTGAPGGGNYLSAPSLTFCWRPLSQFCWLSPSILSFMRSK
jgi:ABC-type glycerol-3-phosphate transport system substrate-binding protein